MIEITGEVYEEIKKKVYDHLDMGLPSLAGGITTEDFMVISGDSGSGKSTIALYMACHVAKYGRKVAIFNLENSEKVITDEIKKLGFDFDKDFGERDEHGRHRLIILNDDINSETSSITMSQIQNVLTYHEPSLIVIDLFNGLLSGQMPNMIPSLTEKYAIQLRKWCVRNKCLIIVTEQLTKDNKRVTRPMANDIAGGASLTRKATIILMIYQYNQQNAEKNLRQEQEVSNYNTANVAELIVRKSNKGLLRVPTFVYVKKTSGIYGQQGFVELDDEQRKSYVDYVFGKK